MRGTDLIILTPEKELRERRVSEIIADTEGTFFSNSGAKPLLFHINDIGYSLREEDLEYIKRRLSIPNLFNIKFDTSIRNDLHCFDKYLQIRRAA